MNEVLIALKDRAIERIKIADLDEVLITIIVSIVTVFGTLAAIIGIMKWVF